jgi:hypothetical protein
MNCPRADVRRHGRANLAVVGRDTGIQDSECEGVELLPGVATTMLALRMRGSSELLPAGWRQTTPVLWDQGAPYVRRPRPSIT